MYWTPSEPRPEQGPPDALYTVYRALMNKTRGLPNDDMLARMHATWMNGGSVLPNWLGLQPDAYRALRTRHFPRARLAMPIGRMGLLDDTRLPEREDLKQLLLRYRAARDPSEVWIADIIATACMGSDHLWQDLGLWCRQDLSTLLAENFPRLAAKNERDMKWKKFLYKQLCQQQGIYTCRAPSCEVCADYVHCFGHPAPIAHQSSAAASVA